MPANTKSRPDAAEMARARKARDASYDGVFWVCVRTTGVFCRPSCPARTPREQNVQYAFSAREALAEGFRPCKRCRPMETDGQPPDWVAQLLAWSASRTERRLRDADLLAEGITPVQARRYFLKHYGMTFHAYHRAVRLGAALDGLKHGGDTLAAGGDSGYSSDSGFRSAFAGKFQATPGRSREVDPIRVRSIESPVGRLDVGATERGVCLVEFGDRRALPTELAYLEKKLRRPVVPGDCARIHQMVDELQRYFAGELRTFTTKLDILGTPFQQVVWAALMDIPYGQTISYGELARRVGRPTASRAVGQANGKNHIAIVIPCHRVVQANGQLRGYGGGLWRKQWLLDLERGQQVL